MSDRLGLACMLFFANLKVREAVAICLPAGLLHHPLGLYLTGQILAVNGGWTTT